MADKTAQLILDALSHAVQHTEGAPLHGNKTAPGLFPTTAAARQAAEHCKTEGLLRVVRTESRGKTTQEICAITDKGLAQLLAETSPKYVLESCVHAIEARQLQFQELIQSARHMQQTMDSLRLVARQVLECIHGEPLTADVPAPASGHDRHVEEWRDAALQHLRRWQSAGSSEDCPLPEIYRRTSSTLSIGGFHDGLRRLHDDGQIYLHPWTGPLYALPEPPFALLVGHEVLYYASKRPAQSRPGQVAATANQVPYYEYAP